MSYSKPHHTILLSHLLSLVSSLCLYLPCPSYILPTPSSPPVKHQRELVCTITWQLFSQELSHWLFGFSQRMGQQGEDLWTAMSWPVLSHHTSIECVWHIALTWYMIEKGCPGCHTAPAGVSLKVTVKLSQTMSKDSNPYLCLLFITLGCPRPKHKSS